MQHDPHGFFPYLHVGASREHVEDIHDKIVEDVLVLRAEGVDSVQDNDLDVVVRFFLHQFNERLGCGCREQEDSKEGMSRGIGRENTFYSYWILCEGCEDRGGFVFDGW